MLLAAYGVTVKKKDQGLTQRGTPRVDVEYVFEQNGVELRCLSKQSTVRRDPQLGDTEPEMPAAAACAMRTCASLPRVRRELTKSRAA